MASAAGWSCRHPARRSTCPIPFPRRSTGSLPTRRRPAGSARPISTPTSGSSASKRKKWRGCRRPSSAPATPRFIDGEPSFRGAGAAREPGIHAHRPLTTGARPVFMGSGPAPAGHPGMTTMAPLLDPDEPNPVMLENESGNSVFFLTCDHAGRVFPRRLGRLGLPEAETLRHIAWDIGIGGVGRELSRLLDAPVILQTYSRLVIDCNRDPKVPSSIPEISENTEIPGNRSLDETERAARVDAIFRPYHNAIGAALDRRAAANRASALVALH